MTTPITPNIRDLDSLLVAPAEETPDQRRARFAALRALAQRPSLDSDALTHISRTLLPGGQDYFPAQDVCQVLQIVAAHPNTPPTLLAWLIYYAPQAFCSNPIAPLIPLESPDWVNEASELALLHLLRCVDAPPALVAQIAARPVSYSRRLVRAAASLHIALREEIEPARWQDEVRAYWRQYVAEDTDAARDHIAFAALGILPEWAADDSLSDIRARLWHAADPTTTSDERERIILKENRLLGLVATLNPAATPSERRLLPNINLTLFTEFKEAMVQARDLPARPFLPAEDAVTRCRELMLIGATIREALPDSPFIACAAVMLAPERIDASDNRSDQYEYWERLLGWTLGVRPDKNGKWAPKTEALLDQLTCDANCLVRAAARGRLADPNLRFEW